MILNPCAPARSIRTKSTKRHWPVLRPPAHSADPQWQCQRFASAAGLQRCKCRCKLQAAGCRQLLAAKFSRYKIASRRRLQAAGYKRMIYCWWACSCCCGFLKSSHCSHTMPKPNTPVLLLERDVTQVPVTRHLSRLCQPSLAGPKGFVRVRDVLCRLARCA